VNVVDRKMQLRIASKEPVTAAIEAQIGQRVRDFEDYVNSLPGCTRYLQHLRFIVIARAGRVRIHLDLPGGDLTIDQQDRSNLSRAIDEAFTAARTKLEQYVSGLRSEAKPPGCCPDIRVSTIFDECYGVLETPDGREVVFLRGPAAHPLTREAC
jgi:ribosome-associated translation inhibitor RaiA